MLYSVSRLLIASLLVASLAACKTGSPDFTAMLKEPLPTSEQTLQRESQQLGLAYDRRPGEKYVSLRYGQVLRQLGQTNQAVAVLQRAAITNLKDPEVSAAYGKVLAEAGRFKEAAEVLSLAHTPDRPNWQVLSTQGSIADQMGEQARAQEFYISALKIAPGEPSVLSNLGLSYALSRRLGDAERVLAEAARHPRADDRIRANLAMVRELQRKNGPNATNAPANAWADIRKAEADRKARSASPRD